MKALAAALLLAAPALAAKRAPAPLLRALTYNVAGLPVIHPHLRLRLRAIAERLKALRYDIVAVQETWRDQDAYRLGMEAAMPNFTRYERRISIGTGLALYSRWPIVAVSQRQFTCRPSALRFAQGESVANKGVLMTRIMTPKGPLDVYNLHLISDYSNAKYHVLRLTQLFELTEMVEKYSADRPFLIMGDLNIDPVQDEPEYRMLTDILGLEDVCLRDGRNLCGESSGGELIDHILLPRGRSSAVAQSRVVLAETVPGTEIPLSDHAAVEASLDEGLLARRLNPDPERRAAALRYLQDSLSRMIGTMNQRQASKAWIPIYGFLMTLRYDKQLGQLWDIKTRAETARIRTEAGAARAARHG